jgi:NADH oxidase (H2O2-forming)
MKGQIVIVGGGPAGVITALTAKNVYPHKEVSLIKEIGDGVIPCAIPYMMNTLDDPRKNAMGDSPLENAGIEVLVDKVIGLDAGDHSIDLVSDVSVRYEKLVLATGTQSVTPAIPGIELVGVHAITKSLSAMTALREDLRAVRNLVIIGGGFIGAEFADELAHSQDLNIHLVEILPDLLMNAFDEEIGCEIGLGLEEAGVSLHTGQRVNSIDGETRVSSVTLEGGEVIPAEAVLIGIGAKPECSLARDAGLRITDGGSIWVDDYMRTQDQDVFAVGDCALKRDFFTRKEVPVLLASTATAEARIAGTNLYSIRVLRQIQGTIAAFSTRIGDVSFASAGMTCRASLKEGIRCISATAEAPDHHPAALPGSRLLKVMLVFSNRSGILLGGQIRGGASAGELINVVALAIQKRTTVRELDMMQIATHPLLTPAPTVHPLINAAHMALAKMRDAAESRTIE